ncbi:MAG: zinc-ribbon domain-containing protein [Bacilli bacterium]|nr:zinc-ribbon domain-containing protein [Bacilli bacterium]
MKKYCTNCGKEMDGEDTFCVECGTSFSGDINTSRPRYRFDKEMLLPAIGLALSNTVPFAGLIVSIIALIYTKKHFGKGRGVAISGIITSLMWVLVIITWIIIVCIKVKNR